MTKQLTHAVISDTMFLYTYMHYGRLKFKSIPLEIVSNISEILELALEHSVHTVWVTPESSIGYFTEAHATGGDVWDIRTTTTRNPRRGLPDILRGVTGRRLVGSWDDKRQITIAYPQWTPWQWEPTDIAAAGEPLACLVAIIYLEKALGQKLHYNPGVMGRKLIESTNATHSRPGWIEQPEQDLTVLPNSIGFDLAYMPGLDQDQDTQGQFLHSWDKNSMYLAAAGSAYLGTGNVVHLNQNEANASYTDYPRRPGYWRIANVQELPSINPLYKGQEWVTTPLLKLLYDLKVGLTIEEAYVWPDSHRVLDKFAELLWSARQSLKTDKASYPHERGRELAYHSIKRIATAGVGMLANADASKYAKQWFRPDWRAIVVEEAKCRLVYKLLQVERECKALPLAVATDAVYYLSPEQEPSAVFPGMFEKPDALGGWKVLYTMPATPGVKGAFKPGNTAGTAARTIRKIASQEGE